MDGKKFSINKVFSTIIERDKFYVNLILLSKGIRLSNTELLVLTTFFSSGYNKSIRDKIIENKLVKNSGNLGNILLTQRKNKLLVKNDHSEQLCEELSVPLAKDINIVNIIIK
jgi:hypothetical protein